MLGGEQLLCFRRVGDKVAAIFENPRFQATGDASTAKGGKESFAFTVAAMLKIVPDAPDGGLTVDMAPFLSHDVVGIADALNQDGEGYKIAPQLSAVDTSSLRVFPDNIEIDAVQTFASDKPGREASSIAPDAR